MRERDRIILLKIKEEAELLLQLIDGYAMQNFLENEMLKRAVCMTLINIGELVKLLTDEAKRMNSTVPWRSITGLRDVTAHGYQTLQMEDIWETVTKDIPELLMQVRTMLRLGQ
jgi:uncharacterized protein with HEPN domain